MHLLLPFLIFGLVVMAALDPTAMFIALMLLLFLMGGCAIIGL